MRPRTSACFVQILSVAVILIITTVGFLTDCAHGQLAFHIENPYESIDWAKHGQYKAIHKDFVDVNEKGTEAAAVTTLIMEFGIEPDKPKPKKFIVDHPFIFMIREDQTGSILFVSRIVDPTK